MSNPFADVNLDDLGPPPPRQCKECGEIKPGDQFDGLREMCRVCDRPKHLRTTRRNDLRFRQGIHRLVAAATASTPKIPELAEVCSEMIKKFDGVRGFVDAWKRDIDESKAGSKTRLDQYKAIYQMLATAAQDQREQLDLARMTEEQIEEAIAGYVFQVIHPDDYDEEGGPIDDVA